MNNNNNDKSSSFDFGQHFGGLPNGDIQPHANVPNPFSGPFANLPFSGLDQAAAIMQLSQMLGSSAQQTSLQQNAKQQLNVALLQQQLQQASEMQKPDNLPTFGNNNRRPGQQPPAQNDGSQDRKRVIYSKNFTF